MTIRLLTRKFEWTDLQKRMMSRAALVYKTRGLILAAALGLLVWGGSEVDGRLRAQMLLDKLLASPLPDVSGVIAELKPYRRWIDPLLRKACADAKEAGSAQKQLSASLALLPVDEKQLPYLKDRLLTPTPKISRSCAGCLQGIRRRSSLSAGACWRIRALLITAKHFRRRALCALRSQKPALGEGSH